MTWACHRRTPVTGLNPHRPPEHRLGRPTSATGSPNSDGTIDIKRTRNGATSPARCLCHDDPVVIRRWTIASVGTGMLYRLERNDVEIVGEAGDGRKKLDVVAPIAARTCY